MDILGEKLGSTRRYGRVAAPSNQAAFQRAIPGCEHRPRKKSSGPWLMALGTAFNPEERREYSESEQVRKAWSELLERYQWSHFVTLTFRREPSVAAARLAFGRYVRRLEQRAGGAIAWFRCIENGRAGERVHIHALLARAESLPTPEIQAAWRGTGRADVRRYTPGLGAASYVVKGIGRRADCDYDISSRRPFEVTAA